MLSLARAALSSRPAALGACQVVRSSRHPSFRHAPFRPFQLTHNQLAFRHLSTRTPLRNQSTQPLAPPPPPPPEPSTTRKALKSCITGAKWTAYLVGSSVVGILFFTGCIFVHDAFTYNEKHLDRVPVSPLALHPELGGPKNLPIASVLVGDEEDEVNAKLKDRPRLVIVGAGWGVGVSVLFRLEALLTCSWNSVRTPYRLSPHSRL